MTTVLIVVVLVILLLLGASFALGRRTEEVEAARDTEYVELEGAYIRYNVVGGGPPVLLVHGWLSSSRVWEALAGRLAQRFTVYTLDLEGFGESDKPISGYGVRYGSRLLYAFCAHFGLTRASVVGHDVGGAMAAKLAADHPDVVGRLVLVSTPADEEQIDLPTPLWLATLPVIGALFYTLGRVSRPVRQLWLRPFVVDPDDLTDEVIDDAGMSTPAAMQKTLAVTRREISGGRLARQARIIKVPMLLIAGEEDQIVDPQSVGAWARTAHQAEVCLIDDAGHLPMIERTGEFNAQILAFLTGDARYLDYVIERRDEEEEPVEDEANLSGEEEDQGESLGRGIGRLFGRGPAAEHEETHTPPGDVPQGDIPEASAPDEATVDLPLHRPRPHRDPEEDGFPFEEAPAQDQPFGEPPRPEPAFEREAPERSSETPGIHRRHGDRFVRETPGDEFAGGTEDHEAGDDLPLEGSGQGYERRRTGPRGDSAAGRDEGGMVPEIPRDLFQWPEAWQEYRPGDGARRRSSEDAPDEAEGPEDRS